MLGHTFHDAEDSVSTRPRCTVRFTLSHRLVVHLLDGKSHFDRLTYRPTLSLDGWVIRILSLIFVIASVPACSHRRAIYEDAPSRAPVVTYSSATLETMRKAKTGPARGRLQPEETLRRLVSHADTWPSNGDAKRAVAEQALLTAQRLEKRDLKRATELYLMVARRLLPHLTPSHKEFTRLYNMSVSRLVMLTLTPEWHHTSPIQVQAPRGLEAYTLAQHWQVNGFRNRVQQAGIGAAVIGYREASDANLLEEPYLPRPGLYFPLSALVTFPNNRPLLTFHDVSDRAATRVRGKEVPLAADYTAPWARQVQDDPNNKPLLATLRPGKVEVPLGLTFLEPYRPDQIPVIFIHGLASNGATWDQTINDLLAHPQVRERYQFWLYQYPSGYPFYHVAAELRQTLSEVRKRYDPGSRSPNFNRMVLVGHSMGGLVSSAQIRRANGDAWASLFKRPLDQLTIPAGQRDQLRRYLQFAPEGYVKRVIFCAVPHRGSTLADGWVGRLASKLIKLPGNVLTLDFKQIAQDLTDTGLSLIDLAPNSITRLQYYNPILSTLVDLPIDARVTYHTIAGDRGLRNAPKSSDGVVSYQSSHLEGAASEVMVPAWHSVHKHPEAIAEIQRILLEHLAP